MESVDATSTPIERKRGRFRKIVFGVIILGLVTIACLGAIIYFVLGRINGDVQSVAKRVPLLADKPVRNHIAIVDNNDNLQLVSPEGTILNTFASEGQGYQFPTWSPDGRYLAFVGVDPGEDSALYVSPASKNDPEVIYNQPDSAPFYLYWSPDSQLITFLTQEESGLAMRQADTRSGTGRILGEGSPFYWSWSPTGEKLLMHVGGARSLSDEAHISILENAENAERVELDLAPGRFQAPVWSADNQYFYYIATNESDRESIYRTDANTLQQTKITNLSGFGYMVLSPTGEKIAYSQIRRTRPPFGEAYIVDTDGENHQRITDDPIGSMFWSPDGTKLALLTVVRQEDGSTARNGGLAAPLPQKVLFRWLIYHVETEELEPLISFTPTLDFLQIIPFFDQYHLSLTFWSPDSRYLVVAKENLEGSDGTIWIVDTTGAEEPREIGEGTLAVWSWQ